MSKWLSLAAAWALVMAATPVHADLLGRFSTIFQDTPVAGEASTEAVAEEAAPLATEYPTTAGWSSYGAAEGSHYGYPFRSRCCESRHCLKGLWDGFCEADRCRCRKLNGWLHGSKSHGCQVEEPCHASQPWFTKSWKLGGGCRSLADACGRCGDLLNACRCSKSKLSGSCGQFRLGLFDWLHAAKGCGHFAHPRGCGCGGHDHSLLDGGETIYDADGSELEVPQPAPSAEAAPLPAPGPNDAGGENSAGTWRLPRVLPIRFEQ